MKKITRREVVKGIGAISLVIAPDKILGKEGVEMNEQLAGKKIGDLGTFALNKGEPIHRWYSYLEGYSSALIENLFDELPTDKIKAVYDPFGGTGTTMLVASRRGICSYYTESNPFMCEVIEAKINKLRKLVKNEKSLLELKKFRDRKILLQGDLFDGNANPKWDGFEHFFKPEVLKKILKIKGAISKVKDSDVRSILRVALGSVIVRGSLMIRRGDLRAARDNEKNSADFDVVRNFYSKLDDIIIDIDTAGRGLLADTISLGEDARAISEENLFDVVITSPPYLNGTNYIRNTKLELKATDYILSEDDMSEFHSKGIVAGINNVSKKKKIDRALPCVQPYIDKLAPVAYDRRIVEMVKGYFNDMRTVLMKLGRGMKDGGYFIMDIGDSQFAGIHIPTHDILAEIAKEFGFEKYEENILRERISKNGMRLSQRLLKFRLNKAHATHQEFKEAAIAFVKELKYRQSPYNGRNWGHEWHSLCSYHGKLKPAIAHFLVSEFTKPGDVILDPMSGVGTIPFEACLQGRIGIGNDLSEMAYVVSRAKLLRASYVDVLKVTEDLARHINEGIETGKYDVEIEAAKNFGYNKTLKAYFHENTLAEIVIARKYFISRIDELTSSECMVLSALLHILHGNRPYALSRKSHPLTPYAPQGDFIYKNVVEHLMDKLKAAYSGKIEFNDWRRGMAIHGDFSKLAEKGVKADWIICSPPFADSIKFYMQNWMRLWMCGWEKEDFDFADERFLDVKQRKNFDLYKPFFEMANNVLSQGGKIILHLGKTDKIDMAEELSARAAPYFREVYRADESVADIEKHGVKDKGGTIAHQFLFLQKDA